MKIYQSLNSFCMLVMTGGSFLCVDRGLADDPATQAAQIAERQEHREKMNSLTAAIEDLWTAQRAQQKRLSTLVEEVSRHQMEAERGSSKYATREEIQKLSESVKQAIKELDERREADRKLILEEIRKLAKLPAAIPSPSSGGDSKIGSKGTKGAGSSTDEKHGAGQDLKSGARAAAVEGYEYEVKKGETLSTILQAYNEVFKKEGKRTVTLKQLLELEQNQHVKPNMVVPGQIIFIPDPPKK